MQVRFRSFLVASLAVAGVGVIGSAFVPNAHADSWDKRTTVTVNKQIQASNQFFNPGTYVWRLIGSPSSRPSALPTKLVDNSLQAPTR